MSQNLQDYNNKIGYYIPLSSQSLLAHGVSGPSHCVFSSPKVTYSQNTQALVNLLAEESRLTYSQRNGFQSILRSGKSLPEKWDDAVTRRREYNKRRIVHGRELGLNLNQQPQRTGASFDRYRSFPTGQPYIPGARRSYDSIKASGVLEPPNLTRNYISNNREQEKVRLAHKMAFGSNPTSNSTSLEESCSKGIQKRLQKLALGTETMEEKPLAQLKRERLNDLIEEIQERIAFIKSMAELGHDKSYHTYIICQIKEKVGEMHELCENPTQLKSIVESLQLSQVYDSYG